MKRLRNKMMEQFLMEQRLQQERYPLLSNFIWSVLTGVTVGCLTGLLVHMIYVLASK